MAEIAAYEDIGLRLDDGSVTCESGNQPPSSDRFVDITRGQQFGCGVRDDGTISCWSSSRYPLDRTPPSGTAFTQIVSGQQCTCRLTSAGTVECFSDVPDHTYMVCGFEP